MTHLVDIAVAGPRLDQLVLRGSLALKSCLGHEAREPGDVDWIIRPGTVGINDLRGKRLINDIVIDVTTASAFDDIRIEYKEITRTDIWIYDDAPGHRVVIPWRCGDLPLAEIQMDFVFGESLLAPVSSGRSSLR
ncbi:nucleotidyl transferase AbiEii/AbiGii toxin family protein [Verrucomicrobium spinosum]|uniref:nucleotidyl transferase AbiEii/AbiGii toxin family protein n=1 Tax=Verrucomicrobium spinosum TaxID=2736 RepID=UPI00155DB199|nr:nucleotidyl transferase AbiEii/AbiGii toxin family protein [Verrucomicrobium spinosum]